MTLINNRILDAIHNVADIIICNIWPCWQAEANFEEVLFHAVCVNWHALIYRLFGHWLPGRACLDFLTEHKDTKSRYVVIRLAIGSCRVNLVNNTSSTSDCGLDYLLVSVLLALDMYLRIKSCCIEPEVCIEARVGRLLMDMNPWNISKEFLVEGLNISL